MRNEALFFRKENPGEIVTGSDIIANLLSQPPQNVVIKNGHSHVMMPSKTLRKIKSLGLEEQLHIAQLLSDTLHDASKVTLIP